MGYARDLIVGHGAAELIFSDVFVSHGLDDVGAGDEHVRRLIYHEDEVSDGRGIDRTTGARAHDGRDLRHHPAV